MQAYYFIDVRTGNDVFVVPANFVAELNPRENKFLVDYNPSNLERISESLRINRENISKGIETGLIYKGYVADGDLAEFRRFGRVQKILRAK